MLSRLHLLIFNGAVLTACAVFDYNWRATLLSGLMLFLPLLDRDWKFPSQMVNKSKLFTWFGLFATGLTLLFLNPDSFYIAISTLLLIALPEEWFFRAYFLKQLENQHKKPWAANGLTSALFTLLHIPTQGLFGLLVFFPSLLFGWIYQRTQDIVLVILLHTLSNIIFIIYLIDYFNI